MSLTYREFFQRATGGENADPYPYQALLAEGKELPTLLDIPTGLGKTLAVVLAWLWRRVFASEKFGDVTPRRLVYCLPMRVLVEQTFTVVIQCLDRLGLLAGIARWSDGDTDGLPTPDAKLIKYNPDPSDYRPLTGWAAEHCKPGTCRIAVHLLMGGEDATDWALYPERDAVLIGTQDMLLSRVLNRGYAASRARWPMEFGLLNNDCISVFDEVQLMGSGLATTAQLSAFRNGGKQSAGLGTFGTCQTLWMSATAERKWFDTVDHDANRLSMLSLSPTERNPPSDIDPASSLAQMARRLNAVKVLRRARLSKASTDDETATGIALTETVDSPEPNSDELKPDALADLIMAAHRSRTAESAKPILSVVIINTVKRATLLFDAIRRANTATKKKGKPASSSELSNSPELLLLHSRYRPIDRHRIVDKLLLAQRTIDAVLAGQAAPATDDAELREFADRVAKNGLLIVSTQVIEAGIDISAKLLVTELAPWASLVQRFGRCNRRGEHETAEVIWLDLLDEEKLARPYTIEELRISRSHLVALEARSVGPSELQRYREVTGIALPYHPLHVLRRKDLIDLFDTTPDLAGNDLDVSRYVRDTDDHDVYVFWRDVSEGGKPGGQAPPPRREELCSVSLHEVADFVKAHKDRVWRWDFLESQWVKARVDAIFPGQMFLIASDAGGYLQSLGWAKDSKEKVEPIDATTNRDALADGYDADGLSEQPIWQTIAEHTDAVCCVLETILSALCEGGLALPESALRLAARWHDRGKSHDVFQAAVPTDAAHPPGEWAKAPGRFRRYRRRHFRHELASALAALQAPAELIAEDVRSLVAYLIAAHHGKVRLSIRSLPNERVPADLNGVQQPDTFFARGIWDMDALEAVNLGAEAGRVPDVMLSLEPMKLGLGSDGEPSWTDRMLQLRDRADLGPFRLAFLETVLRAGDCRASAAPSISVHNPDSSDAREGTL